MNTKFLTIGIAESVRLEATIIEKKILDNYNLQPGSNMHLIYQKLNNQIQGAYVECGVRAGNTLFAVAEYLKLKNDSRTLYGCDTFCGFPDLPTDKRDEPEFFNNLLEQELITEDHYKKASNRTNNFTDKSHLSTQYFCDVGEIFEISEGYENIKLIQGKFSDTLGSLNDKIAVLFLDCDLYQSYLECLDALFVRVVDGGAIIFDEYYSLKYPGARLAINEFFDKKKGRFEVYKSENEFERICFIKGGE